MKTEKILMATTILATGALQRFRCANFAGATAGATDAVLGVPNADYGVGEQAGVSTHGEILVEAGAAIAAGARVQSELRQVVRDQRDQAGVVWPRRDFGKPYLVLTHEQLHAEHAVPTERLRHGACDVLRTLQRQRHDGQVDPQIERRRLPR